MKKLIAISLFLLLIAGGAFAHAGHAHTYMGTVTMLHGDGSFMMTTIDGRNLTIGTSKTTAWLDAAGHTARKTALAVGSRVVIRMAGDGKAASVKMGK